MEIARANMIAQQIRPWHVLDARILHALATVPREIFAPAEHRRLAFADAQIPLGGGEVMFEPKISARLVQSLNLRATDNALLIGACSGYLAALLAAMCAQVTAVEIDARRLAQARQNLARAGANNVALHNGDAHDGWGAPGEFDAILIGGSFARIPDSWLTPLAPGGRLVGIEGHAPAMRAVRIIKTDDEHSQRTALFEMIAPRLRGAADNIAFKF